MKRKILILGASLGAQDAVSGIMTDMAGYLSEGQELYFCGFGNVDSVQADKNNIIIPTPGHLYRRILTLLQLDTCTLYTKSILAALKKYEGIKFDLVIGVSGVFSFMEAAYTFAVKNNIPFKIVYFDPFVNNRFTKSQKQRKRIEEKWLARADNLYFNIENECPAYLQKSAKLKYFYIPMFLKPYKNCKTEKTLIYGGTFYRKIREPKLLYDFAKKIKGKGFKIECYSELKRYPKNLGIDFFPKLKREDFDKRCQKALALIYAGNSGGDCKSSKYLEGIALHKPVIGINVEPDNEVRKYKYYLDADDQKLIEKLNSITQEELANYNPFNDFKHRDPKKLTDMLFK